MNDKLKKVKEILESAIDSNDKKDLLISRALGILDSIELTPEVKSPTSETNETGEKLPIPNMVWKHVEKPSSDMMMDAVQRHKDLHTELSKNSVSQKNTQFEQLK